MNEQNDENQLNRCNHWFSISVRVNATLTRRVKVLDATEVQFLGAVRNRPRLLAVPRERRAIEVREAQAVAIALVPVAGFVDIRAEAPVLGGLLCARAKRSFGSAQAVNFIVAPAAPAPRERTREGCMRKEWQERVSRAAHPSMLIVHLVEPLVDGEKYTAIGDPSNAAEPSSCGSRTFFTGGLG